MGTNTSTSTITRRTKILAVGILGAQLATCAFLQKREDDDLTTAILCVAQQEANGDGALRATCDDLLERLTPDQRVAVVTQVAIARQTKDADQTSRTGNRRLP